MTTKTDAGIVVPVGSDPYALTADLLEMAKSFDKGLTIRVASSAARDALPKRVGMRVERSDCGGHVQMWTGSKWRWVSPPERYYADTSTFSTTSSTSAKLIGTVTTAPAATYATQVRVSGRLSISSAALSSGQSIRLAVAVSAIVGTAPTAQGRSLFTFTTPGGLWTTSGAETPWIAVPANTSPLPRIWLDYLAGNLVAFNASNAAADNHLWVDVLPADD